MWQKRNLCRAQLSIDGTYRLYVRKKIYTYGWTFDIKFVWKIHFIMFGKKIKKD